MRKKDLMILKNIGKVIFMITSNNIAVDNAKKAQADAIKELADLSELMRKNESNLKLENVQIREKMEAKIDTLKRQLTENKSLWQQLAEAEIRENILKQQL